jgi:glycogen debranching enzyme
MREPIDGVYHGDRRFVAGLELRCDGQAPEALSASPAGSRAVFDAVLRGVDDASADPHVRLTRTRRVAPGLLEESLTVRSVTERDVTVPLSLRVLPDFRSLHDVKAGAGRSRPWEATTTSSGVRVACDSAMLMIEGEGAEVTVDEAGIVLRWRMTVPSRGSARVSWRMTLEDPGLVVQAAAPAAWSPPPSRDLRLAQWMRTALADLAALRLALPDHPEDAFLAAGAPWFFTLFGRDSLWAARMMLPVDVGLAASTLRVLARLQGVRDDPTTEEEPGKIPHELRSGELAIPGEGVVLPPLYYGTIDATALWVCLLAETAAAGMPDDEVRALVPQLTSALDWIVRSGRDGFLAYIDRSGRGLANPGWKDSGDSIQWRDGTLARGPIALCEVQGYAYEAALSGAALLERFGDDQAEELRQWAARLRTRFRDRFWVTTPEGRYPAVALDADGRAVDSLTSNIGHLLGTGILDPDEEEQIAGLLTGRSMSSGFGVRTLSTAAAGYWPLGYHVGSVWAHDSAIIAHGLWRAGRASQARTVARQLVDAAEGFGFRMPELHSGDERDGRTAPVPYPAACRPQAWSAAAAIVCRQVLG